jgi:hypothetical protein
MREKEGCPMERRQKNDTKEKGGSRYGNEWQLDWEKPPPLVPSILLGKTASGGGMDWKMCGGGGGGGGNNNCE